MIFDFEPLGVDFGSVVVDFRHLVIDDGHLGNFKRLGVDCSLWGEFKLLDFEFRAIWI